MCATSKAKLNDKEVRLNLGYFDNTIDFEGKSYGRSDDFSTEAVIEKTSREEMLEILSKHSPEELAEMILQLVDNGEER